MGVEDQVQDPERIARIQAFKKVFELASAKAVEETATAALLGAAGKLSDKTAKLSATPRPKSAPRRDATARLLSSVVDKPAPEDPLKVSAHVATFLPSFLTSLEAERPTSSQKLDKGAPVPDADQILGIADLFAAVQRSMIEWENVLDRAETAEVEVDSLEELEEERDETEYTGSLATYNARRKDGLSAEQRAMKLIAELQTRFNGLSKSQQAAMMEQRDV